jgi:hypothetical protein
MLGTFSRGSILNRLLFGIREKPKGAAEPLRGLNRGWVGGIGNDYPDFYSIDIDFILMTTTKGVFLFLNTAL